MFVLEKLLNPFVVTDDDVIIACRKILREECNSYNFDIYKSCCDGHDVNICFNIYKDDRPKSWETFFKSLRKFDQLWKACQESATLYFSRYSILYKTEAKRTHLHVCLAQSIHDKCPSKQLIQILNNLGMCVSYEKCLEWIIS